MPDRVISASPDSGVTYNATVVQKDGTDSEIAKIQYRLTKEEGTITLSHLAKTYKVIHSAYSGVWHLQLDDPHNEGNPLIVAKKPKWYNYTVTLQMDGMVYEMIRPTVKRRDYEVRRLGAEDIAEADSAGASGKKEKKKGKVDTVRGTKVGALRTDGSFKRSYTITFDEDVGLELPLFCYWLVSLFNKRGNAPHHAHVAAR